MLMWSLKAAYFLTRQTINQITLLEFTRLMFFLCFFDKKRNSLVCITDAEEVMVTFEPECPVMRCGAGRRNSRNGVNISRRCSVALDSFNGFSQLWLAKTLSHSISVRLSSLTHTLDSAFCLIYTGSVLVPCHSTTVPSVIVYV